MHKDDRGIEYVYPGNGSGVFCKIIVQADNYLVTLPSEPKEIIISRHGMVITSPEDWNRNDYVISFPAALPRYDFSVKLPPVYFQPFVSGNYRVVHQSYHSDMPDLSIISYDDNYVCCATYLIRKKQFNANIISQYTRLIDLSDHIQIDKIKSEFNTCTGFENTGLAIQAAIDNLRTLLKKLPETISQNSLIQIPGIVKLIVGYVHDYVQI